MKTINTLLISLFCFINLQAQTKFIDCSNNNPYSNAIVTNSDTNQWFGNTDTQGNIVLPDNIKTVIITHPSIGEQSVMIEGSTNCIDSSIEDLEGIVIEVNVKEKFLESLNYSFEMYKKENKGKRFYNINSRIYEEKGNTSLESFKGILVLDNIFNTSFNNYELSWSAKSVKNKTFDKIETFTYLNHIDYNIFASKSNFKDFIKYVNANKVSKIKNTYYIYPPESDEFISVEIDPNTNLVTNFINTELTINSNLAKPTTFEANDKIIMSRFEIKYNHNNSYYIEKLNANEKYLVDNEIYALENELKQEKLNKEQVKNLKGKGLFGFAFDYVKKREDFVKKNRN